MGLRQTISEWVTAIKDALDLGAEFPDAMEARRVLFAQESARLQHLLEQTQKASQEKDQLIAKLQAVGAAAGSMVVDGPAYYIRRANTLEGPFCTSCFQRSHEVMRIAPAPKPKGGEGTPADWVQCTKCRTPFRSDRISQYLNPARVPSASGARAEVLLQPDKARSGSPAGQRTGPQDRRQTTEGKEPRTDDRGQETEDRGQRAEDRKQKVEPPSHPSTVLRQPPSDQLYQPKSTQPQNSALPGTAATQKDTLRTPSPSPNAMPCVEDPKPAPAPIAVAPQESDAPKPVKTTRKPRKDPKRSTARLERVPTAETGPAEEAPQPQSIIVESPAPTLDAASEAPRPSRTRSRSRKAKDQRSGKAMMTDRSKSTR